MRDNARVHSADPLDIEDMLRNWGAWCRSRPAMGCCASIEHRYRSPQIWYPPGPRVEIDPMLALRVERTMRHLPTAHRLALRLVYVDHMPGRLACRAGRVPTHLWDQHIHDAQQMVENLLGLTRVSCRRNIGADGYAARTVGA